MKYEFGYGNTTQSVEIADRNLLAELLPNPVPGVDSEVGEVERALQEPIGAPKLRDVVRIGEKVAIVTSDITRPMPTAKVMPSLIAELEAGGVRKEDMTLVFALGSHRKQTPEEQRKLAGDYAYENIQVVDSDPDDCVHLGTTSRGTPVDITRVVAEADRVICLGNIEYHYFAGYSGGAKAIMPGCSTHDAIQTNHRFMVQEAACAGNLDGNPIREDIEEAGRMLGIDYILNVVLDEHKKIVKALAGDSVKAHRVGCAFLDTLYGKTIPARADIVIVSQGGAPKDLNLYQTQKALDNAKHAVRKGGTVILVGACQEGLGEKTFEKWMLEAPTAESMVERIGKDFQLGGHKAAAIAMVLQNADIYMVSEMEPDFVRSIFLKPYPSLQEAYTTALEKYGPNATVITMPYGGSVLPKL
ncbi:MAG: nickel-dependent lactate racemase [Clostridia bacterium]|nr:nickel-dependent lactate racemase [Clostridia bacterium]